MVRDGVVNFNLVDEPWVLVRWRDGRVGEVSLLELMERAHEIRDVVGELPTQVFAILRVVVAVLHRSVNGPSTGREWEKLWQRDTLPVEEVRAYLARLRHRFDLFDPSTPFFQVADLRTAKGEFSGLERLIADVPAGHRFFTTRAGAGLERLSFAEAARWLVHCQAFDPSGIKSGAVGDSRVKSGKGYPIGTGWAGRLGGVLAEGNSLKDTLLLHLVPTDVYEQELDERDAPAWERGQPTEAAADDLPGRPFGPLDLYTWQSRRVRLFADENGVFGVLIANGDPVETAGGFGYEPMTVWRRSQTQERKLGRSLVYMPRAHDPERQMWRGLAALLPSAPEPGQSTSGARWIAPTVVKWIGAAREDEYLPADYQVRLRTVGMEYGSQSATSAEIIDDAVAMAVVVLQDSAEFAGTAIAGVTEAEQGTVALGRLAGNLAAAAGGDRDGPRDRAQEIAYAELDRHFRSWLATIHPDSDPQALRRSWHIAANRVLRTLGDELIEQAGPIAWVGRQDNNQHVSTPEAAGWFARSLRKTFELAYNHDQHHDSDPPTSPNPTRTQDDNTRSAPVTDKGAA